MRERAAAKWSRETSQGKEHWLKARRERAALKRQSEGPPEGVETNRRAKSRRDRLPATGGGLWTPTKRMLAQPRMGWKSRFASRRVGSGREGSLPSPRGKPAPLSLCRLQRSMAAVSVVLPNHSRYLLAPDWSETESRVDYIPLTTTWILKASQQHYKASVKWRNWWYYFRIVSISIYNTSE